MLVKRPLTLEAKATCQRHACLPKAHHVCPSKCSLPRVIHTKRLVHLCAVSDAAEAEVAATSQLAPTFASLGVHKLFLHGLPAIGIETPSPIQAASIPVIIEGKNCAIQSYTGSGKTLAYLLPIMTRAFQKADEAIATGKGDIPVQAVVVAPSQELAIQIVRVAQSFLAPGAKKAVQQVIGGANPRRQEEAILANKPVIVVGTPGRMAEMVRNGVLRLHQCPIMVMDEADQLLAPNFTEDMTHLVDHCGKRLAQTRQTVLVSATLSPSVLTKAKRWCPDFQYIAAGAFPVVKHDEHEKQHGSDAAGVERTTAWGWGAKGWDGPASETKPKTQASMGGVEQDDLVPVLPPNLRHYYIACDPRHKTDMLRRVMHALDSKRVLVFMNFQQRLQDTQHKLQARSMQAEILHGEMTKFARQKVMRSFREGSMRAMIVNDVVARGLDVPECDTVVNLELPSNAAHYAHRAGRTGRMGKEGVVVSIVSGAEKFVVEKLAEKLSVPILEAHTAFGEFKLGPEPVDPAELRAAKERKREREREAVAKEQSRKPVSRQGDDSVDEEAAGRPSSKGKDTDTSVNSRGAAKQEVTKGKVEKSKDKAGRGAKVDDDDDDYELVPKPPLDDYLPLEPLPDIPKPQSKREKLLAELKVAIGDVSEWVDDGDDGEDFTEEEWKQIKPMGRRGQPSKPPTRLSRDDLKGRLDRELEEMAVEKAKARLETEKKMMALAAHVAANTQKTRRK